MRKVSMSTTAKRSEKRDLCTLISFPYPDCYVAGLGSTNIENAIYYCGGHFEECQIYQKYMKSDDRGELDAVV